jgi:hypothetical protein
VRQSDGNLEVETQPGDGATFRLFLPRVFEETDLPSTAQPRDGSLAGTETIMVVEDDSGVRDLAKDALQRLGYRVLVADRPASAVRRAAEHQARSISWSLTWSCPGCQVPAWPWSCGGSAAPARPLHLGPR